MSVTTMRKWTAWLVIGVMVFVTGLLLWFGLAIVVRCDRVQAGRVDVTIERRFLGLLTVSSETVPDVVEAGTYVIQGSGTGRQRTGSTAALELTSRSGAVSRRTRFGPAFGTRPDLMAEQIMQFVNDPSKSSLTTWWMPWLVNIGALPFVLVVGALVGAMALRALELLKPAPSR
jgi:hypothetical protein